MVMLMNKFNARKCKCQFGHVHDSKKEAERCTYLHYQQKQGLISRLETQKEFELIPTQKCAGYKTERAVKYIADFYYVSNTDGEEVVEDVKGYKRGAAYAVFAIKRKLMLHKYGIHVREI